MTQNTFLAFGNEQTDTQLRWGKLNLQQCDIKRAISGPKYNKVTTEVMQFTTRPL